MFYQIWTKVKVDKQSYLTEHGHGLYVHFSLKGYSGQQKNLLVQLCLVSFGVVEMQSLVKIYTL